MRSAVDVESEHTYVVKSGDTLSRIAERELGDANLWSKITRQDGSTFSEADAATLRIGQVVILPGKGQHTSKSPATSDGFASLVSRSFYDNRFSNRNSIYTYDALLKAVDRFPQFCREGSDADHKREAAAFLAHIAHESGELEFVEEKSPHAMYRDESNTTFPPAQDGAITDAGRSSSPGTTTTALRARPSASTCFPIRTSSRTTARSPG